MSKYYLKLYRKRADGSLYERTVSLFKNLQDAEMAKKYYEDNICSTTAVLYNYKIVEEK